MNVLCMSLLASASFLTFDIEHGQDLYTIHSVSTLTNS